MLDRGIIKWQPFNSCFDSKQIIRDVTANKNRINLPVLSDDQIHILEEKTINLFTDTFHDGGAHLRRRVRRLRQAALAVRRRLRGAHAAHRGH